ncbi:MAG: hypothetical protein RLY47_135 [Candidatus Parcubacteria bacterium]
MCFWDEILYTKLFEVMRIFLLKGIRNDNDVRRGHEPLATYCSEHIHPTHAGHIDIQKNGMRLESCTNKLKCLFPTECSVEIHEIALCVFLVEHYEETIVVNEQDINFFIYKTHEFLIF